MTDYCSMCGKKLSILTLKNISEDGSVICSSCFQEYKTRQAELKRLEDHRKQREELKELGSEGYISKYLSKKIKDFDIHFMEIYDEFQRSKIRLKTVSQGKVHVDESAVYKDVKWRQMDKVKLDFLVDLENMHELFNNSGIETNYFEILSIFWKVRGISRGEVIRRKRKEFERKQREKAEFERKQREKAEFERKRRRRKEIDIVLSNNFSHYTPPGFEKFIGELFKKMGYGVDLTPTTKDYGVDIVAKKGGNTVAVQVKKYAKGNMVGAREVQQTLGAMWKVKADQSILITTSGFSVYAREQAKEAPIELWDKKILHKFVREYMIDNF